MNKSILLTLSLIVAVGAGYLFFTKDTVPTYAWNIAETEQDESGISRTTVSIVVNGRSQEIGTYTGSCYQVAVGEAGVLGEQADENELSRVQCWFAGGGDEIGLFNENKKMVVKVGELSEGSEEEPAFRGNFQTVWQVK